MIKANELRIGNWIYSFRTPVQVLEIEHKHLSFYADHSDGSRTDGHMPIEDFYPIPLTPEILEKCGFELIKRVDLDEITGELRKDGFGDLSYYRINTESTEIKIFLDFSCNITGNELTHLHQLQNLFYCLCGKELEVNLSHVAATI